MLKVALILALTTTQALLMSTTQATPRTVLVTGATEGIGLVTCRQLVAKGHSVIVHGRNMDWNLPPRA